MAFEFLSFKLDVLLSVVVGLEVASQLTRVVLKRLAGSITSAIEDDKARGKAERDLKDIGPSYVVSTIVAVITGARGVMHFTQLLGAPDLVRMTGADRHLSTGVGEGWVASCLGVERTNYLFLAFMIQDLCHVMYFFPRLGGVEQLFHHTTFFIASVISGGYQINHFPFSWLIMCELSTVFLEARWFLIKVGSGSGPAMAMVSQLFALVFGVTRVLIYGWGAWQMWQTTPLIIEHTEAPSHLVYGNLTLVVLGYGLNLFWFKQIVDIAMRGGKPKEKKDKKAK